MEKLFAILLSYCWFSNYCHAIYLTNTSSVRNLEKNPAYWTEDNNVWGALLEEWALGSQRKGKILQLIPINNGYMIDDRIDNTHGKKDGKISSGKIVNNSNYNSHTYNNNDGFLNNNNNNNIKKPGRPISETDIYLLNAIEKMVRRADFMEKRLRRVEEMLYYVMAGNRVDTQEPCPSNFTRIGTNCYLFSSTAGREVDWKDASKYCKKQNAFMAEFESIEESQDMITFIQDSQNYRGKDFWTGGLNPGLLWIWSNSARPVIVPGTKNPNKPSTGILGDGRCLRLVYDHALRLYNYRGTDCSMRYSFICELPEETSSNEISKIGRAKNILD